MRISFHPSSIRRTKPQEYTIRFVLGGFVTVLTGLVAKRFGPVIGGLFLAFPAIFPAGATLIEKHETEKKRRAGILSTVRGRQAAAVDAAGAALGGLGLAAFAFCVWKLLPGQNGPLVLTLATVVWFVVALLFWRVRTARWWR